MHMYTEFLYGKKHMYRTDLKDFDLCAFLINN
jgi:hypothetical protein